jgi:hypothetical protein
VPDINIPAWLDELTPGAAAAARGIIGDNPTGSRRHRLKRLVDHLKYNKSNRAAWRETDVWRGKERPSDIEVWIAQYELFRAAFRAPDLRAITKSESTELKAKLADVAKYFSAGTDRLDKIVATDEVIATQLTDLWRLFRNHARHPLIVNLPEGFCTVFDLVGIAGYFIDTAAKQINPAGATPYLGKMRGKNAQTRATIVHIADTCQQRFGSPMLGVVAKLASASLGRTVTVDDVRNSLRYNPGRKSRRGRSSRHSAQR